MRPRNNNYQTNIRGIGIEVASVDKGWGIILGWGSEDDFLDTAVLMTYDAILGEETNSRFAKVFSTSITPFTVGWVSLSTKM